MANVHPAAPRSAAAAFHPRSLPKVLLHEHLDGGLRPQTLFELCQERGMAIPAADPAALAAWMHANADSGSLENYLRGFDLTVAAMASPAACERVAFEAAEDALADGCVLAEFRMAPQLLERHGLRPEAVVEAFLAGLDRSALAAGLIVCGMRTDPPEATLAAAGLATRYRDQGVVGFDLAGAERGYPPALHAAALRRARDGGLGVTCHAGESDDGYRVLEAAELGATRIGHGIHIVRGRDAAETQRWIDAARARELHFEVCPSSNVHTGAVGSLEEHPIARMLQAGLSVSCSTDNRLMSAVTLSSELEHLHDQLRMPAADLGRMMMNGVEASFLPAAEREAARREIARAWGSLGSDPGFPQRGKG
jgi:adenosine deaminase